MAKDKDKKHIFLDDVEWGNQETDSVSHEDILDSRWNFRHTKAEIEKRKALYKNKEWYEMWRESIKDNGTITSEKISGVPKPLDGNKKLSEIYKGVKKEPSRVAKVSKTLSGTTHNRSRAVNTPVKNFDKVVDAARYFDVSEMSIKNWCNKKGTTIRYKSVIKKLKDKGIKFNKNNYPIGFEWAEGRENLGAKQVQTPDGIFDNTTLAAEHYNISANAMRIRCRNKKWPEFFYIDKRSKFNSKQLKGE